MAGRERVPVAANETLERVLDRLRSSQAEEIVLDVDERSPLLLSVENLDSLDETAQRQGVRLLVASTSSRVLSAARVFGLPVIDTTAAPSPARTRPDPHARLLAGEPLGGTDAPIAGGIAVAEEPAPDPAKPARPAPVIAFRTVTVGDEPESDDDTADGWEQEPDDTPARPRDRMRRATPPHTSRTARPRLDPYGQPYDEDEDEDETLPAPRGRRRASRIRPGRLTDHAPAATEPPAAPERDEEGWDDGLIADEDDEAYHEEPRPGLLGGIRAFWADVRERVAARRRPIAAEELEGDEEASPVTSAEDDGWDEPPYRARVARATASPTPVADDDEPIDDTGELPPPVATRPARPIRSLVGCPAGEFGSISPTTTSKLISGVLVRATRVTVARGTST